MIFTRSREPLKGIVKLLGGSHLCANSANKR
jgi:hypothetical protein